MVTEDRLREILNNFENLHIVVVGDYFLDYYLVVDPSLSEVSIETGLDAYQVVATRPAPGAAGTVTNNLRAMGVRVMALGALGGDGAGYELRWGLGATGVLTDALILAPGRMTPTYMKPMLLSADGVERELNRIDFKNRSPLPADVEQQVIDWLHDFADHVDGIIVADQVPEAECGVITTKVRETLAEIGKTHPDLIIAADSRARIGLFHNVIVKPNVYEAVRAVWPEWDGGAPAREEANSAGVTLSTRNGRPVFLTMGKDGMLVFDGMAMKQVPAVRVDGPIDVVGAGDSSMAGLASALCSGAAPEEAALVGNLAASVTVRQIGTTGTANPAQILEAFHVWREQNTK